MNVIAIPEELVEALKHAADRSQRSLNREIIHRLRESFRNPASVRPGSVTADQPAISWYWNSEGNSDEQIAARYAARSEGREEDVTW